MNCLDKVSLKEKIISLPNNLETNLSDARVKFSGGQLQRLTLARMFFKNKRILLLDEVASALDEKTKRELIDNLLKMEDKTIFFITHDKLIAEKFDYELIISRNVFKLKKN